MQWLASLDGVVSVRYESRVYDILLNLRSHMAGALSIKRWETISAHKVFDLSPAMEGALCSILSHSNIDILSAQKQVDSVCFHPVGDHYRRSAATNP